MNGWEQAMRLATRKNQVFGWKAWRVGCSVKQQGWYWYTVIAVPARRKA